MQVRTIADVAVAVRNARTAQGLTQAELAERLRVGRDWVVRLEQGSPRLEVHKVLAALSVLGIPMVLGEPEPQDDVEDPFADVFSRLGMP